MKDCVWWVVVVVSGRSLSWPYLREARRLRLLCHRCLWSSSEVSHRPKNSCVSFLTYLFRGLNIINNYTIHDKVLPSIKMHYSTYYNKTPCHEYCVGYQFQRIWQMQHSLGFYTHQWGRNMAALLPVTSILQLSLGTAFDQA